MARQILILDTVHDDLQHVASAILVSGRRDLDVDVVHLPAEVLRRVDASACDVVLYDLRQAGPGGDPLALLREIRARDPRLPVIVSAERGDVASVRRAVAAGATDFLVCGDLLGERVATLLEKLAVLFRLIEQNDLLREQNRHLSEEFRDQHQMVGESRAMVELMARVRRVASIPRPVLIVGERGTGKELVARAIHREGGAGRPMVCVNCAALPEELLESELFGHERGAFTGAAAAAPGRFELASGGTLFLDEIGNMPLAFQQKVLRVVEYGTYTRVGGGEERRSSARVIAASNVDLAERMRAGRFLPDLYDRLSFEVLRVPPLRERGADVELLAVSLLHRFMREIPALQGKVLGRDALAALRRHPLPGNVRELKNIIERAAYRDSGREISARDLGLEPGPEVPADGAAAEPLPGPAAGFAAQVEALEQRLLREALAASSGNQAEAARRLGLSYHQLRYLARRLSG